MRKQLLHFLLVFAAIVALAGVNFSLSDGEFFGTPPERCLAPVLVTLASALALSSLAELLAKRANVLAAPMIAYLALMTLLEAFRSNCFPRELGVTGGEWIAVIANSSVAETTEFITRHITFPGFAIVIVSVTTVILFSRYLRALRPKAPPRKLRYFFLASIALTAGLYVFARAWRYDAVLKAAVDHDFLTFRGRSVIDEIAEAGRPLAGNDAYRWQCDADTPVLGVFVIGESASSTHWGLCGYSRDTNPRLAEIADECAVFPAIKALDCLTPSALRAIFTDWRKDPPAPATISLAAVTTAAGYDSAFINGQNHWGPLDSADMLLFKACSRQVILCDLDLETPYYDDALLPYVDEELSRTRDRKVVFVHLMGSHRNFESRYPQTAARFPPDLDDDATAGLSEEARASVNAYDNSIAYTDTLLRDMIEKLRATGRPAFLVYVSDHGETPEAPMRIVEEALWRIPFVVWFSREYREAFPEVARSVREAAGRPGKSDSILPMFLELLQISGR